MRADTAKAWIHQTTLKFWIVAYSEAYLRTQTSLAAWSGDPKSQNMDAMSHGMPSPKNTFTALEPVTLPMAESALSSACAAAMDAKVSGKEVPSATKVMAVTESGMPIEHPNKLAKSPMKPVTMPVMASATKKVAQPL